MESCALTS